MKSSFERRPARRVDRNKRDYKIHLRDRQNLEARLERKQYEDQPATIFKDSNIHYEIAGRTRAIACGGIGVMHKLVCKLGLTPAYNGPRAGLNRPAQKAASRSCQDLVAAFAPISQPNSPPSFVFPFSS